MATGFVQRWKGKVLGQLIGVGSGGIIAYTATGGAATVTPNDLASLAGGGAVTAFSTQGSAIGNSGIANITSTAAIISMTLAAPVAGRPKTLALITVSSAVQINASPATFDGTNTVLKSTQASVINLHGLSTTRWVIDSVFPGSTTATSILTLSTST